MKLDLSRTVFEPKWFEYREGRIKVRPYPPSMNRFSVREGAMSGTPPVDQFKYCLVEMEGFELVGPDGKPAKLDDAAKGTLFDRYPAIVEFVLEKSREMLAASSEEIKN